MQASTLNRRTEAAADPIHVPRVILLADDLTGACDSGVAFLACGRRVEVVLDPAQFDFNALARTEAAPHETVWACTTESRDLPPDKVAGRVTQTLAAIGPLLEGALLFKKVDSAGRGHFGEEVRAALHHCKAALPLVAPAFPAAGRTVQSGVLHIRDLSGESRDLPLRGLFPHEAQRDIATLPVCSGEILEQRISEAVAAGARILLCDAATQADLDRLAAAALRTQLPILWVGSAGLAHALASTLPAAPISQSTHPLPQPAQALLFVGTPHSVTNLQVLHLERESSGIARAVHRIPPTAASPQQVVAAFSAQPTSALILTGGNTAAFVLRSLGASSIVLAGEIARGIPWGYVQGGLADGCVVITKSGGFGAADALVRAFEFCERSPHETP